MRQGAFAEVYELDVEGDVNRVLFALQEPLSGPSRAWGTPGVPAGGLPWGSQRLAAQLTAALGQLGRSPAPPDGGDCSGLGVGFEDVLARLGVQEHLQRLRPAGGV